MSSPTKKRKHADDHTPSKRSKTAHDDLPQSSKPEKTNPKGKRKEHANVPENALPLDSDFARMRTKMTLSIPPVFANNPRKGAEELLDSLVMR